MAYPPWKARGIPTLGHSRCSYPQRHTQPTLQHCGIPHPGTLKAPTREGIPTFAYLWHTHPGTLVSYPPRNARGIPTLEGLIADELVDVLEALVEALHGDITAALVRRQAPLQTLVRSARKHEKQRHLRGFQGMQAEVGHSASDETRAT